MLKTTSLLTLIVSLLLATAIASAQPRRKTVREELPAPAQTAWDDAIRLTQLAPPEWDKAAAKFQEAYDVSHNPRVLFNVGVCERNLKHYSRAIAKFKQELAEGAGKLSPQDRADIQTTLAALERFIGAIEVTVGEGEATVYIDDVKVGQAPLGPVPADVSSDPHHVRVEKEGFFPFEKRDVLLTSNATVKVVVELEPKVKKSEVEIAVTGAPGASVWIDGIDRGPSPFKGLVEVGPHTFEARQAGYEPTQQRQEVVYKQKLKVQLPLEREMREGKARIETVTGAAIEIDGKLVATTFWEGPLSVGTHTVSSRKDGYNDGKMEIYVGKGEMVSRRLPLTAERKQDWIVWTVGTVLVVGGAVTVAALVFSPKDQQPVIGTLDPGLVQAGHRIRF